MRTNSLRERLREGRPSIGTHLLSSWPALVELAGQSQMFDYVEFVGEYAPYDLHELDNIGRAIDLFPHLSGMMKIEQEPRVYWGVRAIGSGIQNLLFADIRTVEDARQCVGAARAEAPGRGGLHGVGMRRDVGYVREVGGESFVAALDDAVVALMIEKREAVEDIEAILSVPGIDMVQFGPADYAMSIGLAGKWDHPEVKKAERITIETALAKGIAPRAEIGSPQEAARYLEMGVQHFCMGWDVITLASWFAREGRQLREVLGRELPGAVEGEAGVYRS
jgi:2-keto-3-deoxy-L-rhamnonate aldolase RhmA